MVLCARSSTRCGVVFSLSHGLSQVGSRSLWSRSWQSLCRRSWTVCMCHGSACSVASWSRSWMCQCHRSGRESWSLLLVRSSATLVQASGDSTGGRAQIEQIVDVPVPQIWEQSVEVIKVILQEQCQRMRFFLLTACGEGGCGRHVPHVLLHSQLPHARVDSECKRWNVCCVSYTGAHHHHDSTLPLCRSQNELGVTSARVHIRVNRVVVVCSCTFFASSIACTQNGSNDQCDGNQCCPSFGGCLRWHHPGVEPAAQCASTRENSPGSDIIRIDRLTALS